MQQEAAQARLLASAMQHRPNFEDVGVKAKRIPRADFRFGFLSRFADLQEETGLGRFMFYCNLLARHG